MFVTFEKTINTIMSELENETIRLLDGEVLPVDQVLAKMDDDSYYYGYLGKVCLSSSSCKLLLESPKKYRNSLNKVQRETAALRDGKLLHAMALEPETLPSRYALSTSSTRTTKAFKEMQSAEQREVFLQKEWDSMKWLNTQLFSCEEAVELLSDGVAEQPMIGDIFDTPFRAKADYLKDGHIVDYKTTADLSGFERAAKFKWHYDMQAYIYTKLFNVDRFTFLVIEKGSGDIGIFETSESFLESGRLKVQKAVENYQNYFTELDPQKYNIDNYVKRGVL